MKNKDFKMVALSDLVSIPVPRDLSPEAQAQYIAQFKAKYMANFAEEYQELKNLVEGKVPVTSLNSQEDVEEFLRKLLEEKPGKKKESA